LLLDIMVRHSPWVFGKSLPKTGLARVTRLTSAKIGIRENESFHYILIYLKVGAPLREQLVFDGDASAYTRTEPIFDRFPSYSFHLVASEPPRWHEGQADAIRTEVTVGLTMGHSPDTTLYCPGKEDTVVDERVPGRFADFIFETRTSRAQEADRLAAIFFCDASAFIFTFLLCCP